MSQVINIRKAPKGWQKDPRFVYIGREGKGMDGYFGNPFKLTAGETRGATIERFESYARTRIGESPDYRMRVEALHDKFLVCFCAPAACHGDVLARLAWELHKDTVERQMGGL